MTRLIAGEAYTINQVWCGNLCGYRNADREHNNGFGCDHPDQEERRGGEDDSTFGVCYDFSCPVAYQPTNAELAALLGEPCRDFPEDGPADNWVVAGADPADPR
jgi:hypothetical protein